MKIREMKDLILLICFLFCLNVSSQTAKPDTLNESKYPDVYPTFPGGTSALSKYFKAHVMDSIGSLKKYEPIPGKALVKFVITENGKVENAELFKSSFVPRIDSLFLKAVERMPDWIPAIKDGKACSMQMVLPLGVHVK